MHFAAHAYVEESILNPKKYYKNNVIGSMKLIETMLENNIKQFIFSSTCATYGIPNSLPIVESTKQLPINPYGSSKLIVEQLLEYYNDIGKLNSIIFRYFNACGADLNGEIGEFHEPETHLIPRIYDVAVKKYKNISIYGNDYNTIDGTCIRDFIHVDDIAEAHVLSIEYLNKNNGINYFNLGTGRGYSVNNILDAIIEITQKEIPRKYLERRIGDPPELISSGEYAKEKLDWKPNNSDLKTIIESSWNWYSKINNIS